jgi:hypothetical protein
MEANTAFSASDEYKGFTLFSLNSRRREAGFAWLGTRSWVFDV